MITMSNIQLTHPSAWILLWVSTYKEDYYTLTETTNEIFIQLLIYHNKSDKSVDYFMRMNMEALFLLL